MRSVTRFMMFWRGRREFFERFVCIRYPMNYFSIARRLGYAAVTAAAVTALRDRRMMDRAFLDALFRPVIMSREALFLAYKFENTPVPVTSSTAVRTC